MNKLLMNRYTWKVFTERFFGIKLVVIVILLLFILYNYLSPIKQFSVAVDIPISPYIFPFLLSDIYFQIIFIAFVIYFFSNVPFMQLYGIYQVIRMNRLKWALGQIGYILLSALGLTLLVLVGSLLVLFPNISFMNEWGKVLHTLSLTNAGKQFGMFFRVNYEFQAMYSPIAAMGISILICVLVITFIGILMFAISLCISRTLAIGISSVFLALPIILKNVLVKNQLFFSYFSPVSWLQVTHNGYDYGIRILPRVPYVLTALSFSILFLCFIVIWRIKTIDFQWSNED